MKKAILALTLFITASVPSFSQPVPTPLKEDYITKSKHQKTAAWILLGGGVALLALGIGATSTSVITDANNNTAGNVLAVVGVASTLGSIPLFISAAHNKRKAASVSLNMQATPTPFVSNRKLTVKQPSVSFKISL